MKVLSALLLATLTLRAQDHPETLETRLRALLETAPSPASIGIQVVDASTAATLFEYEPARLLLPASNLKLLTSAVALERLGGGFRFVTRVIQNASGDIVLVGAGDPALSGRVFPYQRNARSEPPLSGIEDLADQIASRGIKHVNGDIIGDDRLYPWDPYPSSWTLDDTLNDYGAPVSALTLNDNTMAIGIAPGAGPGDAVLVTLSPPMEFLSIDNRAITGARGSAASLRVDRIAGAGQWRITGSLPAGRAGLSQIVPVQDPALFAATALYDALIRRGISVRGRPLANHRNASEDFVPPPGRELAVRTSPPLLQILQVMDKVSNNLYAELVLRAVARQMRGEGSLANGVAEMSSYLLSLGAARTDFRLDDGSGLSRNALVTPSLLTRVLAHMSVSADSDAWVALLPVGGEDGTLDKRLCCTSGGRGVRAKTGTLARAQSLSGYADSTTYGRVAFSILVNDFAASAADVREWIDKFALQLLR